MKINGYHILWLGGNCIPVKATSGNFRLGRWVYAPKYRIGRLLIGKLLPKLSN